jgi:Ca2+-binding RTX toxin-like protein
MVDHRDVRGTREQFGNALSFREPASLLGSASNHHRNVPTGSSGRHQWGRCHHRGGGDDDIKGRGGKDVICGGAGWDTIGGGRGHDILKGGKDFDSVAGGRGDDVMRGGRSTDEVTYFSARRGVIVHMGSGTARGQGSDTFAGFSAVVGSFHKDTLIGSGRGDYFNPLDGNDVVRGHGGNDVVFFGGSGNSDGDDEFHGGRGRDNVDYEFAGHSVTVNLTTHSASGEGSDRLVNVEDMYGSRYFSDLLIGDGGSNRIYGSLHADDEIHGRGGSDRLTGDHGDDVISGGKGDDVLDGGTELGGDPGNDTLHGGSGTDICRRGEHETGCESSNRLDSTRRGSFGRSTAIVRAELLRLGLLS